MPRRQWGELRATGQRGDKGFIDKRLRLRISMVLIIRMIILINIHFLNITYDTNMRTVRTYAKPRNRGNITIAKKYSENAANLNCDKVLAPKPCQSLGL